jgi:hypothetical protein
MLRLTRSLPIFRPILAPPTNKVFFDLLFKSTIGGKGQNLYLHNEHNFFKNHNF